jgi:hypothetical protein
MRPIQPTIPEFPALRRPPADLLRADLPTRPKAALTVSSDSPPGQAPADDDDAWIDDEDEWEPGEREETAETAAEPRAARERAAIPPAPSNTADGSLARQSVGDTPQSGSAEPEDEDEDEWEPDDDESIPGVTLAQSARETNGRASDRASASKDELTEEFFSTPPEPEPTDFSDIDSLAAAAMKIDPKRQEMARKVVMGVMSSMAFLLVVSAGVAALGRGDDRPSVQAAPSAVHGNLSAAAELAASRAPSTITYQRAEAEAARQNAEATELHDQASDLELEPPSKRASPEEVAAYRRALARKQRIKAAKKQPRPTGTSGGMLRRF